MGTLFGICNDVMFSPVTIDSCSAKSNVLLDCCDDKDGSELCPELAGVLLADPLTPPPPHRLLPLISMPKNPGFGCHSRTFPSLMEHDTIVFPSLENDTADTGLVCPSRICHRVAVCKS